VAIAAAMRSLLLFLLILALVPVTYLREPMPGAIVDWRLHRIDLMPALRERGLPRKMGEVELIGAWQLTGRSSGFGNYSTLGRFADGTMVSLGDKGGILWFTPVDGKGPWRTRIGHVFVGDWRRVHTESDAESAIIDPGTQRLLVAYEGSKSFYSMNPDLSGRVTIDQPELTKWPPNMGPESMVRLADGRVLVIAEANSGGYWNRHSHPAMLFPGIPRPNEVPAHVTVEMPEGFRPTDATLLPDGRILVLGRKVTLLGFFSTISIADPSTLRDGGVLQTRQIARIGDSRIRENYEGMTAVKERDGSITLWLISDNNLMVWVQRTLMLKLRLDPQTAAGTGTRP